MCRCLYDVFYIYDSCDHVGDDDDDADIQNIVLLSVFLIIHFV